MASLVSQNMAVTPYHVLSQSGLSADPAATIMIELLGHSIAHSTLANVLAADEKANVAVLGLVPDVDFSLPDNLLPSQNITPAGRWSSYCSTSNAEVYAEGTVGGPFAQGNYQYQTLSLDRPMGDVPGISGAPVIWNEQLVGVVALANADSSLWYATLISQSVVQGLVGASPSAQDSSSWLSKAEIASFSPEAQTLISRANQLRLQRKLRVVHMIDLLRALAEPPSGQFAVLLRDKGVDLESLIRAASEQVEVPLPSTTVEWSGLPPLSSNVRRALITARNKAREMRAKSIDVNHILFGALSVERSRPARALRAAKIGAEIVRFGAPAGPAVKGNPLAGVKSDSPAGRDLLNITPEVNALASVLAAKDTDLPLALGLFGEWGSGKSFFMKQLEARINALRAVGTKSNGESSYCSNIVQISFNAWSYIDTNLWASLASKIFDDLAAALAKRRGNDSREERELVLAATSSSPEVVAEAERKKAQAEEKLKQAQQLLAALQESQESIDAPQNRRELLSQAARFAIANTQVKEYIDRTAEELGLTEAEASAKQIGGQILELRGTFGALVFTARNSKNLWIWVVASFATAALSWVILRLLSRPWTGLLTVLAGFGGFLTTFLAGSRRVLSLVQDANASKKALASKTRQEIAAKIERARKSVEEAAKTVDQLTEQVEQMHADRRMATLIRERSQSSDYTQHLGIIARVRADFQQLSTLLREARTDSEKELPQIKERQAQEEERKKQKDRKIEEGKKGLIKETKEHPPRIPARFLNLFRRRPARLGDAKSPTNGPYKESKSDLGMQPSEGGSSGPNNRPDTDDKLFPTIDRIILYIDDLDRCPEKNVVEVLQAVHLLLAFPLFVVVVGVDPRWLLRSLGQQSAAFGAQEEKNGNQPAEETDPHWQSTPMNYLEKIFQIPFTLRPIGQAGFIKLVKEFASRQKDEGKPDRTTDAQMGTGTDAKAQTRVPPAATNTAAVASPPAGTGPPAMSTVIGEASGSVITKPAASGATGGTIEPADPAIDPNPSHLSIDDRECKFMETLYEFITSPRTGKRFINIYRLIRASLEETELATFVGPQEEYQVVQTLLAILTGYPAEATEILKELIEGKVPSDSWGTFLRALEHSKMAALRQDNTDPVETRSRAKAPVAPQQPTNYAKPSLERWTELFEKLHRLENKLLDKECRHFSDWAPCVARYSFQSGRVLLYHREQRGGARAQEVHSAGS